MGRKKKEMAPEISFEDILKIKDEVIQDLEARLDGAFKEQEEMLKEVRRLAASMEYYCHQIGINTGEITLKDVCYWSDMIQRTMAHKFEYKPMSFE